MTRDHGGLKLADYLIDKLQAGRKYASAVTSWSGDQHVHVTVTDDRGDRWTLEIRPKVSSPDTPSVDA